MDKLGTGFVELLDVGARGAIHIGLLGRGIGASLSPLMHRKEGERLGLNYHYHLVDFDVLGLANEDLGEVVALLSDVGFRGINVTHPFKQQITGYLDDLAADAAEIGAVNTVLFGAGGRVGQNTDCWGFAESFRQGLPDVTRRRALQIGAGGAGAAVARALVEVGVEDLAIFDTDAEKAKSLADRMSSIGHKVAAVADPTTLLPRCDGIVNATPIGMDKYPGVPIDPKLLAPSQWVSDIIYFPRTTDLIKSAAAGGCATLPGTGMAIFQAVKAFELFTGRVPSRDEMRLTFEAAAEVA